MKTKLVVNSINGLLLVAAWLFILPEIYLGLISGLAPALGGFAAVAGALVCLWILRIAVAGPAIWRKILPGLLLALSLAYGCWSFAQYREKYIQQHGYPRRCYGWSNG